jgi:hypothetical protein
MRALIFLPDKDEVSEQFWIVCSKDSNYLYPTRRPHVVITIVISRMKKGYGEGGRINESIQNLFLFGLSRLVGYRRTVETGIILRWIVRNYFVMMGLACNWLRILSIGGLRYKLCRIF